jgi:UDP-N-acetylmuramoyl-tripeptide--D-alanyl-D-alanine ligase
VDATGGAGVYGDSSGPGVVGALTVYLLGPAGVLIPILFTANLADLALGFLWYLERNLSMKFVHQAQKRLAKVKPTVVAITGSYGKTSTKGYVAHIVGELRAPWPPRQASTT